MRLSTSNQHSFIKTLLAEREVSEDLSRRVALARDLATGVNHLPFATASGIIDDLQASPRKNGGADVMRRTLRNKREEVVVPEGRYALHHYTTRLDEPATTMRWSFFRVTHGKGKWEGRTFVVRLVGQPGDYREDRVDLSTQAWVLQSVANDPEKASKDFGRESGYCGVCGSALSDPESLARGIGPVCAGKF